MDPAFLRLGPPPHHRPGPRPHRAPGPGACPWRPPPAVRRGRWIASAAVAHATPGPLDTFAPDLFAGRLALVTGGGSGIGRCCAVQFARLGADVVVAGRTAETLEATAAEVAELGRTCLVVPTNIRDTVAVDALRDRVLGHFGRAPDFLINNAGGQFPALPSEITDNGWRAVVDLNLNGTWNMVNRFMAPMTEQGYGAIVNVVHIYAFERGAPTFVHSGAARAGVVSLTRTMAPYLGFHGVTINALAPGMIDTEGMHTNEAEKLGLVGEVLEEAQRRSASQRMGTVEETAAVILFLCSPAARFVNGAALVADGGEVLGSWPEFWPKGSL
jgi:NAD(P)-dependent dehydrogenase (short-subunit alcohol dehydrogenase family)